MDKYDDTSWHTQESGVKEENAGAHIAFYFCWLLTRKLLNGDMQKAIANEFGDELEAHTPYEYLRYFSDGKLIRSTMNDEAATFSDHYYEKGYPELIEKIDGKLDHISNAASDAYDIADTWRNAEIIAKALDQEFSK
jgi:hypothetical protein